jgi:two-component system, response regulator PdtaR
MTSGISGMSEEAPVRILIVEDDFLIALELENRLIDAGFEVTGIAITAGEALSMATLERPALAIMDIRLADRTDGVEAATELFNAFGIRSIFASAHADAKTRERAALASPIGWVQKPYPAEALIRLINEYLRT